MYSVKAHDHRGNLVVQHSPRKREIGVRSPGQTKVIKISSESFTAKRSATGVSVTGPRR